jgi:hypothetical protein
VGFARSASRCGLKQASAKRKSTALAGSRFPANQKGSRGQRLPCCCRNAFRSKGTREWYEFLGHSRRKGSAVFRRPLTILACLAFAACSAATPPPDTAQLPFAAFGTMDNDVAAANQASWAFASPDRTRNNPVDAARACAAIDYLAGQLSSSPRWLSVSPLTRQEMLRARSDVRRVLGVTPEARSQVVVNALLRFAAAWEAGDQSAALLALSGPGFTLQPQQTLQVLSNLPYVQTANVGSIDAAREMLPGGDIARGP